MSRERINIAVDVPEGASDLGVVQVWVGETPYSVRAGDLHMAAMQAVDPDTDYDRTTNTLCYLGRDEDFAE